MNVPDAASDAARFPAGASAAELERLRLGTEAAVRAAAAEILAVLERGTIRYRHKGGEGPVTEADHAADAVLHGALLALLPGAQWVSEESTQGGPLDPRAPTWVVDPLDGTREFMRGLPEYGVSVGLFLDGRLALGAVAVPATGDVLSGVTAGPGRGGWRNGAALPALDPRAPASRVVVSRWDVEGRGIDRALPFDTYPCGSAAVKLVHVGTGLAGAYLSTGPRSTWDVAGGVAVVTGVGGVFVAVNGEPLELHPTEIGVPPYVAGSPAAAREVVTALSRPPRRRPAPGG